MNGFEKKKIAAWLRDTITGHEITEAIGETRCMACEKVREFETRCLMCQQRRGVLLVYGTDPDGPGWCEVYCERGIDVFAHQKLSVEPEEELLAEKYLESRLSWRARELFVPVNRRMTITIRPWSAEDALATMERVECIHALNEEAKRKSP